MADNISVVIPVYNSENALFELYQKLKKTLESLEVKFEIILIDDNSIDDSYKKIVELNNKDKRVKGIKLAQNFGQQNAIICGFNYVKYDYVITLDDDLQHQPEDLIKLYNKIKEGYDVVYAIPQNREYGFFRKLGSKLTNFLFNLITSKNKDIRVSSYRIIKSDLVEKITESKSSFVYISAILLKYTNNIGNIYVSHYDRKHGKSNYNIINLIKLFMNLYIYYGNLSILKYLRKDSEQFSVEKSTF
ncbi:MAG TPA: glycosyltransferase family 2 protein [Halanaerobiales bacterium]|nr:glycosyltransferase family 2 protein [Halanaerobiales bacterium]